MRTRFGELEEFTPTVARIPIAGAEDMPVITVTSSFDWKFWAAIGLGGIALWWVLYKSVQHTARH